MNNKALVVTPGGVENQHYQQQLFTSLQNLWMSKKMLDITFKVEGQQIQAHQLIISASSKQLCEEITEINKTCKKVELNLNSTEVTLTGLQQLLTYLYFGKVGLNSKTCLEVEKAAQILGIPQVISLCRLYRVSLELQAGTTGDRGGASTTDTSTSDVHVRNSDNEESSVLYPVAFSPVKQDTIVPKLHFDDDASVTGSSTAEEFVVSEETQAGDVDESLVHNEEDAIDQVSLPSTTLPSDQDLDATDSKTELHCELANHRWSWIESWPGTSAHSLTGESFTPVTIKQEPVDDEELPCTVSTGIPSTDSTLLVPKVENTDDLEDTNEKQEVDLPELPLSGSNERLQIFTDTEIDEKPPKITDLSDKMLSNVSRAKGLSKKIYVRSEVKPMKFFPNRFLKKYNCKTVESVALGTLACVSMDDNLPSGHKMKTAASAVPRRGGGRRKKTKPLRHQSPTEMEPLESEIGQESSKESSGEDELVDVVSVDSSMESCPEDLFRNITAHSTKVDLADNTAVKHSSVPVVDKPSSPIKSPTAMEVSMIKVEPLSPVRDEPESGETPGFMTTKTAVLEESLYPTPTNPTLIEEKTRPKSSLMEDTLCVTRPNLTLNENPALTSTTLSDQKDKSNPAFAGNLNSTQPRKRKLCSMAQELLLTTSLNQWKPERLMKSTCPSFSPKRAIGLEGKIFLSTGRTSVPDSQPPGPSSASDDQTSASPKFIRITSVKNSNRPRHFLCILCGFQFSNIDACEAHILRKHIQEDLVFEDEQDLAEKGDVADENTTKTVKKMFMCDCCGFLTAMERFIYIHRLYKHSVPILTSMVQPYCDVCEILFPKDLDMEKHRKKHKTHYRCNICLKRYVCHYLIIKHMQLDHQLKSSKEVYYSEVVYND